MTDNQKMRAAEEEEEGSLEEEEIYVEHIERKLVLEERKVDVSVKEKKLQGRKASSAIASNVEYAEDMIKAIEKVSSFVSDKSSGFSDAVKTVVAYVNPYTVFDYLTQKDYNVEEDVWSDIPELKPRIFLPLSNVESKKDSLLCSERVYYQSQLHLRLYYSLTRKTSTTDFDKIYTNARASRYWKFVDNSRIKTIGEYALLELAIDCVMLLHIRPHMAKSRASNKLETEVSDNALTRAFELIYTRLLRHLCAFVEAYIDLIDFGAGAMMTINAARFLLTRSYNRQNGKSGGQRVKSGNSPPLRKLSASLVVTTTSQTGKVQLLKELLKPAEGNQEEVSEWTDIRYLQQIRMKDYHKHLASYIKDGCDKEAGLSKELGILLYLLDPRAFTVDKPYPRTHKRATLAIELTHQMVEHVCTRLYPPIQEDEIDNPGEKMFTVWKNVVRNHVHYFRYYGSKEEAKEAGV
jgi:hypothetical protein